MLSVCLVCSILLFPLLVTFFWIIFYYIFSISLNVNILMLLVITVEITTWITDLLKSNGIWYFYLLSDKDHHTLLPLLPTPNMFSYYILLCSIFLTLKQNCYFTHYIKNVYLDIFPSVYILVASLSSCSPEGLFSFGLKTPL